MNGYEKVIGLEIHVELSTKTKIFCGCSTAFGAPPNTNICPVCMAMPGTLPVLNKKVVEYAVALGLALNCDITGKTVFDRKNYFYPDNPQNYQISQLYSPIGTNGYLQIGDDTPKKIGIHEIHMEEDAGKLIHDTDTGETKIDYNRAGVPLIEIVTEPDMRTAEEVTEFLKKLRATIQYLEISDCRMNEGSMRVDVNLSVHHPNDKYGTRTEMKNLNSFRAISNAIENEFDRQVALLESGNEVEQETRRWDDEKKCSYTMRSKEDAMDYRYFPEPDLAPVIISDRIIEKIKASKPEFREEKITRYMSDYSLSKPDAEAITEYKNFADIFEKTVGFGADPKKCANRLMGETIRLLKDKNIIPEDLIINAKSLAELIKITDAGTINSTVSKDIFEKLFDAAGDEFDVQSYIEKNGLAQLSDTGELDAIIQTVIVDNEKSVNDYLSGKTKAMGFLIGQVMKQTHGKASPQLAEGMLKQKLDN